VQGAAEKTGRKGKERSQEKGGGKGKGGGGQVATPVLIIASLYRI